MQYSLNEAAAAVGKGRMTIQRAIKAGRISAARDERGAYRIDPAELHRVFPPASPGASHETLTGRDETARELDGLKRDLEQKQELLSMVEAERRREREQLEATIDDLRERLDGEASERKRLTHLLTDEREARPNRTQRSFLQRWVFGAKSA